MAISSLPSLGHRNLHTSRSTRASTSRSRLQTARAQQGTSAPLGAETAEVVAQVVRIVRTVQRDDNEDRAREPGASEKKRSTLGASTYSFQKDRDNCISIPTIVKRSQRSAIRGEGRETILKAGVPAGRSLPW